ncbi:MAG: hypothetical protein CL812_09200 [Confluentimicrobium sp.]|nr:hypothetical protein [Actibacterium sp.]|tara:strand:- start:2343 stop:2546 length:204 start_codon:yes stop_codon:yes gene_type:complete
MTTVTTNSPLHPTHNAEPVDPAKVIGALIFALMLAVSALAGGASTPQPDAPQAEVWRGNAASLPGDR